MIDNPNQDKNLFIRNNTLSKCFPNFTKIKNTLDEQIIDLNSYFRLYYDIKSLKKLFIDTKIEKHFSHASLLFLCYDREVNLNTIKFKNEFDD